MTVLKRPPDYMMNAYKFGATGMELQASVKGNSPAECAEKLKQFYGEKWGETADDPKSVERNKKYAQTIAESNRLKEETWG